MGKSSRESFSSLFFSSLEMVHITSIQIQSHGHIQVKEDGKCVLEEDEVDSGAQQFLSKQMYYGKNKNKYSLRTGNGVRLAHHGMLYVLLST